MAAVLSLQIRVPGRDPPRTAPLPGAAVLLLGVQGAIMLVVGAVLFVAPATGARWWPWPLTLLTSRAVGAWLVGIGVAAVHALIERDLERMTAGSVAFAALGTLQLVALARYGGELRWGSPSAWVYLAVLLSVLATGLGSLALRARRGGTSSSVTPPLPAERA